MFLLLSHSIFQGFQGQGNVGRDTPHPALPPGYRHHIHAQRLGYLLLGKSMTFPPYNKIFPIHGYIIDQWPIIVKDLYQ
jgi:hypothetical protein